MICVTLAGVSPAVESSPSWGPSVQWTETTGAAGPHLYHLALQGTALAPPWGLRTGSDGWHQHLSPWWTGLLLPDRRATEPGSAAGPGREGHGWGADPGLTPPGRHTPGASDLTHITGLLLPQVPLPEPHLLSACEPQAHRMCTPSSFSGRAAAPQTLRVGQPVRLTIRPLASDPRQTHHQTRRRQTRPCAPSAAESGEVEAPPSTQASGHGPKPSGHHDTVACDHGP